MNETTIINMQADKILELKRELALFHKFAERVNYWFRRVGHEPGCAAAVQDLKFQLQRLKDPDVTQKPDYNREHINQFTEPFNDAGSGISYGDIDGPM